MKKTIFLVGVCAVLALFLIACQQNSSGQAFKKVNTLAGGATNETGNLNVTSIPSGAAVRVDGTYRGNTPLFLQGISAGTHTVIVAKPGYTQGTRTVTINPGETTTLNVRLLIGQQIVEPIDTPLDSCTDSDGGTIWTVQGHVYGTSESGNYDNWDSCTSPTNLTEWYCSGTSAVSTSHFCPYDYPGQQTCYAGACIVGNQSQNQPPIVTLLTRHENGPQSYSFVATVMDPDAGDAVTEVKFQNLLTGEYYTDTTGPDFRYRWNSTGLSEGTVTIRAQAYDGELWGTWYQESFQYNGTTNQSNQTNTAPVVTDLDWTNTFGLMTFAATASDPDAGDSVTTVDFKITYGASTETGQDVSPPWRWSWNSGTYYGSATVSARAYDGELWSNWYNETLTVTNNPDSCTDSDGGIVKEVFGNVTGYNNNAWYYTPDLCRDELNLTEWYCSGTNSIMVNLTCDGNTTCQDGACV
ncbi:MAG: PEGA domain-containing protein [Nanoarchaeota archaeon]